MTRNQETYFVFINLEKAFDKAWGSAIFCQLWAIGIRGKLWRIMHKLNKNQEITIMTRFGLTNAIVTEDLSQAQNLEF